MHPEQCMHVYVFYVLRLYVLQLWVISRTVPALDRSSTPFVHWFIPGFRSRGPPKSQNMMSGGRSNSIQFKMILKCCRCGVRMGGVAAQAGRDTHIDIRHASLTTPALPSLTTWKSAREKGKS